ncbi:hypothetical protein SCLCIDRAFT_172415 [Scleroderma citrinum Foug A]|uniref:Uncharacterized protein n=1 Tax=Scleroderma citrinum Foug A TaxID=1036808 RepID=A0A0C3ESM7_9AGAM|nr:hypothetical protein SCLCIDRAFT_172415 [Scleroderma citrinum Foug A]
MSYPSVPHSHLALRLQLVSLSDMSHNFLEALFTWPLLLIIEHRSIPMSLSNQASLLRGMMV